MRSENLVFSAIHLMMTMLVIVVGFSFLMIPFAPNFRMSVIELLCDKPKTLMVLGFGILSLGVALFVGFYNMHKKRYLKVDMGCTKTQIEEEIVREYVYNYWKSIFPEDKFDLEIILTRNQKIEIVTQIPKTSKSFEEIFSRVRNELGVLLARQLGYEKEFSITITQ